MWPLVVLLGSGAVAQYTTGLPDMAEKMARATEALGVMALPEIARVRQLGIIVVHFLFSLLSCLFCPFLTIVHESAPHTPRDGVFLVACGV